MKIIFNENLDDLKLIKGALIEEGFSENEINEAIKEIQKCDLSPGLNYKKIKYITGSKNYFKRQDLNVSFIDESSFN